MCCTDCVILINSYFTLKKVHSRFQLYSVDMQGGEVKLGELLLRAVIMGKEEWFFLLNNIQSPLMA
jgi:hypothetical protein